MRVLVLLILFGATVLKADESIVQASTGTVPDVVIMRNGDRLSGNITAQDQNTITLQTESVGTIVLNRDRIAKVQSKENMTAQQEHLAAGLPRAAPVPTPPSNSFAFALNSPITVVDATQSQQTFGGVVRMLLNAPDLCAQPHLYTAVAAEANHDRKYKPHSGIPANITDTFDGTLSVTNRFWGKTQAYGLADFFGNSSLGIGLQQSYGGGVRRNLFSTFCPAVAGRNYRLSVDASLGARYLRQRLYAPGGKLNLGGIRPALDFLYTRLSKASDGTTKDSYELRWSLWAMPMVNNDKAIQAGGSFQFSLPIGPLLSLQIREEDDFINNAPKLKRKNYLKNTAAIAFTFPKR